MNDSGLEMSHVVQIFTATSWLIRYSWGELM